MACANTTAVTRQVQPAQPTGNDRLLSIMMVEVPGL
jgi:hypothetical protein